MALDYSQFRCLFVYYAYLFLLVLVSSLVNITNYTLSKLRYLTLTESKLLSYFSLYWKVALLLPLCQPTYCLEVVDLATATVCLAICLWWCPVLQYLVSITFFLFCLTLSSFCLFHLPFIYCLAPLFTLSELPLTGPIFKFGHLLPH